MTKRFLFLVLILTVNTVFAQNMSVISFKLLETDLTANTTGTTELDQNGETAALIKVVTTQTGFTFDGGALGIVKTVQKPSEIWVYVPRGLKKITISHPQLGMLRDYYLNTPIEAARTYEMVLVSGEIQTTVKQARTTQYVVFRLTPPNSVVELNGELLQTTDGIATKMMKFGTYNFRVQSPNYLPEAGSITVEDPNNKHIVSISLKPNFSVVTLTVDNDAEIWVNGERKGVGSWTGNLGVGTYEFETRKHNHHNISVTRDILATTKSQTISLQPPTPILGEADINSTPAMANIYIDGQLVGQTPQAFSDLLIGQHVVRIGKQGYNDYSTSLIIEEGKVSTLSIDLEKLADGHTDKSSAVSGRSDSGIRKRSFSVKNILFNMIYVEGGTFTMGATDEQGKFWPDNDEYPTHKVTLSNYMIGETEVTQALWEAVMGYNPSKFKGSNRPVEEVSWHDCQKFIRKLNEITGEKFRLPTEAEWEYAARGGQQSRGFRYPGTDNPKETCWYGSSSNGTHEVGKKRPNELGIYDLGGNVWEWCQDWKGDYLSSSLTNPEGPRTGTKRVIRGGSINSVKQLIRTTHRSSNTADYSRNYIGFRLVL